MNAEGPLLETLTRRLAECPAEFLAEPRLGRRGLVHVDAVVADLLHDLGGELTADEAGLFRAAEGDAALRRNFLRLVLVACWLLHDPWFRQRGGLAGPAKRFLREAVRPLANLMHAPKFVTDPDRREELARACLAALDLRPGGESEAQAQDRLTTLSTAERNRVIAAARAAEQRAQEIREAMARKAAEEAADKWSRE